MSEALREVTQTILARDEAEAEGVLGNCLQAALASALNLPLDAVPHFMAFVWWDAAVPLWLRGRGLDWTWRAEIPEARSIVVGKSPRGVSHAVVGEAGRIVWDPHPSRGGLVEVQGAYEIHPWNFANYDCWVCHNPMAQRLVPLEEK